MCFCSKKNEFRDFLRNALLRFATFFRGPLAPFMWPTGRSWPGNRVLRTSQGLVRALGEAEGRAAAGDDDVKCDAADWLLQILRCADGSFCGAKPLLSLARLPFLLR